MAGLQRVSFPIAKAIKEVGYPQGPEEYAYRSNGDIHIFENMFDHIADYCCDAPTYLDVWLWLWREKKISIELSERIKYIEANIWDNKDIHDPISLYDIDDRHNYQDPEEAIIAAIEYLVENKLLK